ncbi:MAG: type II toxin-antitoxin system RelE family toxin [Candidatus Sulfotelmatobacter sp.]
MFSTEITRIPHQCSAGTCSKIESLALDPERAGCKRLKGYKDHWRIRIGDWRVVYIINDRARLVSITRIAHRREVYD